MIPNTTPTPNELYNGEMKKMSDTELRIVLIVTRATLGWVIDKKTGMRKTEDWISQKQLMEKSGKSNRAISTSVKSCVERGWIEARDKNGVVLERPEERSGKRVFYRLGRIFLDKISTSEDSSQEEPVKLTTETSEVNDIEPVKKVHSTKETITKETIQNTEIEISGKQVNDLIEMFKEVNPSYQQLFKRKNQREAVQGLLKALGREKLETAIKYVGVCNTMPFAPTITTPLQLEEKIGVLRAFIVKEKVKIENKKIVKL